MAERRRRQDWARPPGPPPAPRMEHPGTEHNVPPYTSLQANRPEHRGAAQGGERAFAPRQPADQTPPTAQSITTALALDSKIPIRAPGRQWCLNRRGGVRLRSVSRLVLVSAFPDPQLNAVLKDRSEEHTSELQSTMRSQYDGYCLKK